jgi:Fic family protein
MFNPKYTITPKLLSNIKKITVLIERLNSKKYPTILLSELKRNAFSLSSYSSTSIEGNPLPLSEVKKILENKPKDTRDSEKEVLNYNSALKKLSELIDDSKFVLDLKTILEIQKMATLGLIDKTQNGKLRTTQVYVKNPRLRKIIYMAPLAKDVEKLLEDLINFANSKQNKIDPLILAGIFHKQFVIIHPFSDGNGRTTRLISKLILANMGLNTFSLFSFENYYRQNIEKYFDNVGILGHYYDEKDKVDFTSWLEYFTDGIIDELLRIKAELKMKGLSPKTQLKPYHQEIIKYIEKHGFITDKEYSKITNRAKPTRNLDFRKLISLGIIKKYGESRATYYKLKQ